MLRFERENETHTHIAHTARNFITRVDKILWAQDEASRHRGIVQYEEDGEKEEGESAGGAMSEQ